MRNHAINNRRTRQSHVVMIGLYSIIAFVIVVVCTPSTVKSFYEKEWEIFSKYDYGVINGDEILPNIPSRNAGYCANKKINDIIESHWDTIESIIFFFLGFLFGLVFFIQDIIDSFIHNAPSHWRPVRPSSGLDGSDH